MMSTLLTCFLSVALLTSEALVVPQKKLNKDASQKVHLEEVRTTLYLEQSSTNLVVVYK